MPKSDKTDEIVFPADITTTSDITIPTSWTWTAVIKSGSQIALGSTLASASTVTSDKIEVTIRNSGSVDATIATKYVTAEGTKWQQDYTGSNVIAIQT